MISRRIDLREDGSSYVDCHLFEPQFATGIKRKRPALIILPGGAYLYKSHREGDPVAARFAGMGYHTFVFQYATYWKEKYEDPSEDIQLVPEAHWPEQLLDLMKLIRLIREHADEWYVEADQIYLMGFSAGAHIAGAEAVSGNDPKYLELAGIEDPESVRPDGAVLCYPMLDAELVRWRTSIPEDFRLQAQYLMYGVFGTLEPDESLYQELDLTRHVTKDICPVFIWHTFEDQTTSALASTRFIEKLIENKVRCEFHMFETGGHGMSLCDETTARSDAEILPADAIWPQMADVFLKNRRMLLNETEKDN